MNAKADRLKAALRENLKRRKAHARERKAPDDETLPEKTVVEPGKDDARKA